MSITSLPRRAGTTLPRTLASLLLQTRKADEVRLYVGPDFPPFEHPGVRVVRLAEDYGPATKLYAAMEPLPPDTLIVTADDDVIYDPEWLAALVEAAVEHPSAAVGLTGWNADALVRGGTYRYAKVGEEADVLEGWCGVAYRRRFFGPDLLPVPEPFHWVDDVWISSYLARHGVPRIVVGTARSSMSQDGGEGLHHRHDFVELNRRAARISFAHPSSGEQRPALSICISSLQSRLPSLCRLLTSLYGQARSNEVQVLTSIDEGRCTVAEKRTALVNAATGRYICHFDDDDEPSTEYISAILRAIDENPGVDAIVFRGRRTSTDGTVLEFDYELRAGLPWVEWRDGVPWRSPGHLCPIRAELAKAVPFQPTVKCEEDVEWLPRMQPLIKTVARAGAPGEILYFYNHATLKGSPRETHRHRAIFTHQYIDRSGPGSTAEFSAPYREFLEAFIRAHGIRSIVDVGCGDFEIMSLVDRNGASYLGVDVIPERIDRNRIKAAQSPVGGPGAVFLAADARFYEIPPCDLVLCKDVLQHWATPGVQTFIEKLKTVRGRYRFALLTNCCYGPTINTNISAGGWRALDLTAPPFSAGEVVFQWSQKDVVLVRGRS